MEKKKIENIRIKHEEGEIKEIKSDYVLGFFGLIMQLGPILDWGLNINKKTIEVWGTGKPFRELIFVDDIADACIFFMNKKIKESLINIGSGKDMRIKDYAKFLIKKLKLKVKIKFKKSKPDGVFRKVLDVSKAKKYGWKAKISLDRGFELTYKDFLKKNIT